MTSSTNNLNHIPPVMNSIGLECNELKHAYDQCFNNWFSDKFLKGDRDISVCEPLLQAYTECVKKAMKAKNIDVDEVSREILGTLEEKKPPGQTN